MERCCSLTNSKAWLEYKSIIENLVTFGRTFGAVLLHKLPQLFSFAKKKHIVFAKGSAQVPLHGLFHLTLSQQAHAQLLQLQTALEEVSLKELPDKWSYI